jgi:hypothetical protein
MGMASGASLAEPSALPPDPPLAFAGAGQAISNGPDHLRPFSAVGIAVKVGAAGLGAEAATPLAHKFNLRGGASFFNYNVNNLVEDGFNINGTIALKSVNTSLDWFPFGGKFRVSPGVTIYNGNRFNGTATVPGGNTITLNDQDYTSSPTDPIIATFGTPNNRFGSRVAPSVTVGFGNLVPRNPGNHWSFPFEIGFQYIKPPVITLSLTGTACSTDGCQSVTSDPTTQANIEAQQAKINSDIYNLRFYPILSFGVGYKF